MGKSDIEIARAGRLEPIEAIAGRAGLEEDEIEPYGWHKAKVRLSALERRRHQPDGTLALVTAMTPTPAGEGKSTTTIGLADALRRLGKRALVAIREPSLGPCFGVKGGAAGGGHAQVVPMEDINLHFTGDIHAVTAAHNLLAALVDNHLHHGNSHGLDARRILWKRVLDLNDRALRNIVVGLEELGYGHLPICVAKTQNSLSDDPKKTGRPHGFQIVARDARLAGGAGFVIVYAGNIMTMPGLPQVPNAEHIDLDREGNISGLS